MNKKAEKILNTTINLLIREGIKKTTMDDIAENTNVSKVTIYKYFGDKDTLYLEVGKHIFSKHTVKLNNIAASNEFLINKFYDYLTVISDFINSGHFELCIELTKYNQDVDREYKHYLQTYRGSLFNLIDNGMKDALFKSNLDREMIFHYIDMGIVYYQQSSEYRNRILNDSSFKQHFLLFHISNIFIDGEKMLLVPYEMNLGENILDYYIRLAKEGTKDSIGEIMKHLNADMTLAESKFIDFALGHVQSDEGFNIMEHYLFHGTQIQRNYSTLYFGRRGEYLIIRKAYDEGLIDAKQAFSR